MIKWCYIPNFCSDCGEQVKTVSYFGSIFSSEQFCNNCIWRLFWIIRIRNVLTVILISTAFFWFGTGYSRERVETASISSLSVKNSTSGFKNLIKREPHICGAKTRKGQACQRLVRGDGYCWQHKGLAQGEHFKKIN